MEFRSNCLTCEIYRDLRQSVGWNNWPRAQAEAALQRSLFTLTVWENGAAIAMGRLLGDGMYDMIADVVVRPEFQGKGIGTQVMEHILAYAKSTLPVGGRLSVHLTAEKGKEAFYERLGFKRVPHEFCGSGMRKVIYHPEVSPC